MKNYALILIPFLLATATVVCANDKTNNFKQTATIIGLQERVEVTPDSLPEKVKESVGYKTALAWNILKAYLITNDDQSQWYELFVQKPDGETWIKINKEGNVLN